MTAAVDTFTELLRVSVFIVLALVVLAGIIWLIEWAASTIRRHLRRPWWTDNPEVWKDLQ